MPDGDSDADPPVDRCPFCEDEGVMTTGRYDGRILLGGRGMYRCPVSPDHKWQDLNEKPDHSKAVVIRDKPAFQRPRRFDA